MSFIILLNIFKGNVEPKIFFILLSSSLPAHTPTTYPLAQPINQASLLFWVVPVFPITLKGKLANFLAVPVTTTSLNSFLISFWFLLLIIFFLLGGLLFQKVERIHCRVENSLKPGGEVQILGFCMFLGVPQKCEKIEAFRCYRICWNILFWIKKRPLKGALFKFKSKLD